MHFFLILNIFYKYNGYLMVAVFDILCTETPPPTVPLLPTSVSDDIFSKCLKKYFK